MSEKKTEGDGGSAFPMSVGHAVDNAHTWNGSQEGMSLRDYFAGQALAGTAASQPWDDLPRDEVISRRAYTLADAMIAERSQS